MGRSDNWVPQEPTLGPDLLYIFVRDLQEMMESTLSKFTNTKVGGSPDTPPGWGCYPKGPRQAGRKGREVLCEIQEGQRESPAPGRKSP